MTATICRFTVIETTPPGGLHDFLEKVGLYRSHVSIVDFRDEEGTVTLSIKDHDALSFVQKTASEKGVRHVE